MGAGARSTQIRAVGHPSGSNDGSPPGRAQELQRRSADRGQVQGDGSGDPQPAERGHRLAKRLIDFASGLTYALDGGMQRVADKVFLLTPRNVEVSAEERARLLEKGFFNQY